MVGPSGLIDYEHVTVVQVQDFKPPDACAAASTKRNPWVEGSAGQWWYKCPTKEIHKSLYGHATDVPGGLQIALDGSLKSSGGRVGNGVYHVEGEEGSRSWQAVEYLWKETLRKKVNGGCMVVSALQGSVVIASKKNGQHDVPAGSKYEKPI